MIARESHGSGGRVCLLALDRPEKLNAFNRELYAAATVALEAAERDDGVGAVVLTGRGRAFCAGADVAELAAGAQGRPTEGFTEAGERFLDRLDSFEKPLIAAVNGLAVGIGTTLLTYADLVVAGASARFRTPFASLGVAPEAGSSWRLPQRIGWQNAAWLLLSGQWIDAPRALEMGLALRCVPDEKLLPETLALADAIAAQPLGSLRAIKRTLSSWRHAPTREARAREGEAFAALLPGFRPPLAGR
jgi:enoyl-CoA hydratase/carnithine racemase